MLDRDWKAGVVLVQAVEVGGEECSISTRPGSWQTFRYGNASKLQFVEINSYFWSKRSESDLIYR